MFNVTITSGDKLSFDASGDSKHKSSTANSNMLVMHITNHVL